MRASDILSCCGVGELVWSLINGRGVRLLVVMFLRRWSGRSKSLMSEVEIELLYSLWTFCMGFWLSNFSLKAEACLYIYFIFELCRVNPN